MNKQQKLEMLLKYAELGLRVFYLRNLRMKRPVEKGWKEKASSDPQLIKQWVEQYPWANWMIATGKMMPGELGVIVWDIDNKPEDPEKGKFKTGFDYLKELLEEKGKTEADIPKTWTVRTPTGGLHYYFLYPDNLPEGVILTKYENVPKTRMDIRANGGLIVVPPSIHIEVKKPYQWVEGRAPWEIPIAPMPEWLLEAVLEAIKPERKSVNVNLGEMTTPEELADYIDDESLTWEKIQEHPENQNGPVLISNGWLRYFCPLHWSDNQPSLGVSTDEKYYGYYRCHSCGRRGYVVGTPGWYRWQDYKKKKGLKQSSQHAHLLDSSIAQSFEFESLDGVTFPEPPSEDQERNLTWQDYLSTYSEIRKANAHLRAFAETFKKRYPNEDDLLESIIYVEKKIERAKRVRSVKIMEKWLPELVSVYTTIQLVYDEDNRRIKEEKERRKQEREQRQWSAFLRLLFEAQGENGLSLDELTRLCTGDFGLLHPKRHLQGLIAVRAHELEEEFQKRKRELLRSIPKEIRVIVEGNWGQGIPLEKFEEMKIQIMQELDRRLYVSYGDCILTKYESNGVIYYEVTKY